MTTETDDFVSQAEARVRQAPQHLLPSGWTHVAVVGFTLEQTDAAFDAAQREIEEAESHDADRFE